MDDLGVQVPLFSETPIYPGGAGLQLSTQDDIALQTPKIWLVATQIFLMFIPIPGEMIQFDSYFSDGLVQPPTRNDFFRDFKTGARKMMI